MSEMTFKVKVSALMKNSKGGMPALKFEKSSEPRDDPSRQWETGIIFTWARSYIVACTHYPVRNSELDS